MKEKVFELVRGARRKIGIGLMMAMCMAMTCITAFASGGESSGAADYSTISTAMTSAISDMVDAVMTAIAGIIPYAIVIFGSFFLIRMAIKAVKIIKGN